LCFFVFVFLKDTIKNLRFVTDRPSDIVDIAIGSIDLGVKIDSGSNVFYKFELSGPEQYTKSTENNQDLWQMTGNEVTLMALGK